MRQDDIEVNKDYLADTGGWRRRGERVTVVDKRLPMPRGRDNRLIGVQVRILNDQDTYPHRKAGDEIVINAGKVQRPWTEEDDARETVLAGIHERVATVNAELAQFVPVVDPYEDEDSRTARLVAERDGESPVRAHWKGQATSDPDLVLPLELVERLVRDLAGA